MMLGCLLFSWIPPFGPLLPLAFLVDPLYQQMFSWSRKTRKNISPACSDWSCSLLVTNRRWAVLPFCLKAHCVLRDLWSSPGHNLFCIKLSHTVYTVLCLRGLWVCNPLGFPHYLFCNVWLALLIPSRLSRQYFISPSFIQSVQNYP